MIKNKRSIKILLIITSVVILSVVGYFAIDAAIPDPVDLDEFLDKYQKKLDVAGMAISISENDEITYFKSYGYMDVENKKPINEETLFLIASISKTVTATAVMQLYEDGIIDLDADINDYIPIKIINPNHPSKKITTRMLLTHTSSIADNYDVYLPLYTTESGGGDPTVSLNEFVEGYFLEGGKYYFATDNFLEAEPGETFQYSNCGFALLGYIVEQTSGMSFNDYCNENIFTPLNMNDTGWFLSEIDIEKLAISYEDNKPLPHYSTPTYPDGCLRTSANDFSKFLAMMMNNGKLGDVRILKEETIKEILTPQISMLYPFQGLAWNINTPREILIENDSLVPGHLGADTGVATIAFYVPKTNKSVQFYINTGIGNSEFKAYQKIIERLYIEASK